MVRAMFGFWKTSCPLPFLYFLEVPQKISSESTEFFTVELGRFRGELEEFGGRAITDDALRDAIRLFNADRDLLRRLSALRVTAGVPASLVQEATLSSMILPKQQHLELMQAAQAEAQTAPAADGLPLFLSAGGHVSRDIPRLANAARREHPGLDIELLPPVGEYPRFRSMVRDIARSAIAEDYDAAEALQSAVNGA